MPSSLIDTHSHLHDRDFFSKAVAEEMLERATKNHIEKIICIGTSIEDSLAARDFVTSKETIREIPELFWTFGIHPENAKTPEKTQELIGQMNTIFSQGSKTLPVAIGEIGLDYHYPGYNRDAQTRLLEAQLGLADSLHLPVSFHVREAFPDFLPIIANFPKLTGVIHSFSDSKKHLKKILDNTKLYIGVNGLATYSTLPLPPLERIVLETDAPFLTPVPFRGIINEPSYVHNVADWLAHKLGQDYQVIAKETTKNAKSLFRF